MGNIDKELQKKIKEKVFPGTISNHHLHRIPALQITFSEMQKFGKYYCEQILENSKALAKALTERGFKVLGKENGFSKSHQVVVDVYDQGSGDYVAKTLEKANIILNKNIIPQDNIDAKNPRGLRIGVQEMTRYGMKETEMEKIAGFIKDIVVDKRSPEEAKIDVADFRKNFQELKYCF